MSDYSATYIWATGRIIQIDPSSPSGKTAPSFDALHKDASRQTAIVWVAHRGSIVRQVALPNVALAEANGLVRNKMATALPAGISNYVFGFRLGKDSGTGGKTAVVGAVREDSLRKILAESKAANIHVAAVLPAPFGAWLVAANHGMQNGIVLSREDSDLCIDVIADGELRYSRFCAMPTSVEAMNEEIEQTCMTAGVQKSGILCLGDVEVPGSEKERRGLGASGSSVSSIQSRLFTLELPEHRVAREVKRVRLAAQTAIAATVVAVTAWSYVLFLQKQDTDALVRRNGLRAVREAAEAARTKSALAKSIKLQNSARLIDVAFQPSQTFGDLLSVIASDSDDQSWFTGISLEKGKPMTLRGQAKNHKTVSKLASKLSRESRLRNVKLIFVNETKVHDTPIVQFAISGDPIGNLPFDREIAPPDQTKPIGGVRS